jgi:E3 ubiquitin-protein ligase HUWE1
MLLENCGNRSIYASSPYLSDLLNSTSLSLVASTLQIGTQLAQRYQASFKRMGSTHRHANAALLQNHYNINLDRVQQLSLPFVHTTISSEPVVPTTPATPVTPSVKGKDKAYFSIPASANKPAVSTHYANDLVSLVRGKQSSTAVSTTEKPEVDWSEWGEVRITYYETSTGTQGEAGSSAIQNTINFSPQAPATPTPLRRTSNLGQSSSQRSNRVTSSEDSPTILTRSPTMHAEDTQSQSTLKVLEISKAQIASSSVHQILKENVPKVPAEMKYELLSRLRVAKAFSSSLETRQEVLAVRILAITNLAYIHTESVFLEKVLKQDSEEPRRLQVVYQLAELIHPPADPDSGISRSLQTIALSGLEALAQHSLRFIDICTALNTNVTHGVLLYIVRKAVAEMATDEPGDHRTEKDEWRDALFSLLSHVATLNRAGNELVAAGLVPILLEVLTLRTSIAERNYQKVINFVDAVLYNVRDAFQILVSSSGLEAISDLVVFQTKSASEYASGQRGLESKYRSPAIDYEISYLQQQSIKWLFKFCHHVMSSSSPYGINFDRLMRHLIDSSQFLNSLREVISHARVFGSAVWTNAVAILNDFINNEPTSFSIIAEAGLSRAFLEAVTGKEIKMLDELKDVHTQPDHLDEDGHPVEGDDESIGSAMVEDETHPSTSEVLQAVRDWTLASGILPSSEAIHIIPQTFGAICLNSSGMRMFQASNALASFFEIFESPEHVKCMHSDPSLAANLGSTFDELARHHPPLKTAIMHATFDMLARVGHLCKSNDSSKSGAHLWTTNAAGSLVPVNDSLLAKTSDLVVGSSKGKEKAIGEDSDIEMGGMSSETTSNEAAMDKKTSTAACIFATSSFLSTVFSNHGIRVMIVERGGIEYILDLAELTCLPENSSEDRSRDMLHKVIAMLSEQKPHLVMPSLLKRTQAALDDLAPFAQYREDTPYFSKFIQTTGSSPEDPASLKMFVDDARLLKSLINVQSLTTALEKCFGMANYERRHTSNSFYLTNLADYYVSLVRGLGPLLGAATREDSMLQRSVPLRWKRATRVKDSFGVDSLMMEELMGIEPETTTTTAASDEESTAATAVASNSLQVTKPEQESAPFKNFQALRIQLSKIVRTVNPLFQALGKALVPKRNPEAYQKQSHVQIADAIADVVLQQLVPFGAESSLENFNYWIVLLHTVEDILVYGKLNQL